MLELPSHPPTTSEQISGHHGGPSPAQQHVSDLTRHLVLVSDKDSGPSFRVAQTPEPPGGRLPLQLRCGRPITVTDHWGCHRVALHHGGLKATNRARIYPRVTGIWSSPQLSLCIVCLAALQRIAPWGYAPLCPRGDMETACGNREWHHSHPQNRTSPPTLPRPPTQKTLHWAPVARQPMIDPFHCSNQRVVPQL